MNTETGKIYRGDDAIDAAKERGEKVIYLTKERADYIDKRVEYHATQLKWAQPRWTDEQRYDFASKIVLALGK